MVKVCLKPIQAVCLVVMFLVLAACGSQATKPESVDADSSATDQALQAENKSSQSSEVLASTPQKTEEVAVQEEPVVEIMAGKPSMDSDIAVEPIPAAEQQTDSVTTEAASGEVVSGEKEAVDAMQNSQEHAVSSKESQEAAVAAAPQDVPPVAEMANDSMNKAVPASSGPDNFVVTVGPKTSGHPAFGKGHALGFVVNGVSGKELVLERGKTYTFDIRTDPKHDVYISSKAIGWGSAPIAEGVENAYIYNGRMTFTPSASTPEKVYYACRNHPYMGAVIHVVDPGQTVAIKERKPVAASSASAGVAAPSVTESQAKQKVMFAEMLVNGQGAKRVQASQNEDAKKMLSEAKVLLGDGKDKLKTGNTAEAFALAERSLKLVGEATRLVPSEEAQAQLVETYKSLLAEISDYEASYKSNYEKLLKANAAPEGAKLDENKYADLKADAAELAGKGNYVQANEQLQQAQKVITTALHKMLDSKTIVFELNFDTPEDEYKYELKRFVGYEELIPVAIEAKKPAPGALKLMESFVEKARKRRDEAVAKAAEKDFPTAIAMMQQATQTVQRALRMVGVSQ